MNEKITWDELIELRLFYSQEPFGQMVEDIQKAKSDYYQVAMHAAKQNKVKLRQFLPEYCR
jgi:hypothetical protein